VVVVDAIRAICKATFKKKKMAGIFCSSGEAAAKRLEEGFGLVTPGNDVGLLSKAAKAAIASSRRQREEIVVSANGY